jgi:hypothetical protein
MKPAIELYISTVRLLTIIDQVDMPNNGFKKAIRSIEDWAAKQSYILKTWIQKHTKESFTTSML